MTTFATFRASLIRRAALAFWAPSYEATASAVPDAHLSWLFNNWFAEPNVIGDVTGDWRMNFADLASVLAAWGPCGGCDEDITGDGNVGFADLTDVLMRFEP